MLDVFDTGYTDEYGLRELVDKAKKTLSDIELIKEKELIERLMDEIRKPDGGMSVYGPQVEKALEMGAIDTLLISEELNSSVNSLTCPKCGHSQSSILGELGKETKCPKCGSSLKAEEGDLTDYLFDMAEKVGTKIELISEDFEEGKVFCKTFGGLAGILRYRIA